jgi:hypothetical protein
MNLNYQNTEKGLRYLAAQEQLYNDGRFYKNIALGLAIFAILMPLIKFYYPNIENGLWLSELGVSLLVAFGFDSLQKQKINKAARIQEEFDLDIYGLSWNSVLADNKVRKEDVEEAAIKNPKDNSNWYTPSIGTFADSSIQILLCQRENAAWDSRLKNYAANFFMILFLSTLVIALAIGVTFCNTDLIKMLKDYASPFLPCALLFLQSYRAFSKSSKVLEGVEHQINDYIETYKKDKKTIDSTHLRAIQDKILMSRKENTLVPVLLYEYFKKRFDKSTLIATNDYIKEL